MAEMGVIHKTTPRLIVPPVGDFYNSVRKLNTALQYTDKSEPQHGTAWVSTALMGEDIFQI